MGPETTDSFIHLQEALDPGQGRWSVRSLSGGGNTQWTTDTCSPPTSWRKPENPGGNLLEHTVERSLCHHPSENILQTEKLLLVVKIHRRMDLHKHNPDPGFFFLCMLSLCWIV